LPISRRRFLEMLAAAGVSLPLSQRFLPVFEAYASQRAAFRDVRGPGLTSFSRSVCRDCPNHCGLTVREVDGLPVGLRGTPWHPACGGALCVAGQSQMQSLFDPDRLHSPLQRADAGEPGQAVPWEEALAVLQARIGSLVARGAGERLVVVDGRTPSLGTRLVQSWVETLPGARYVPLGIEQALDRLLRGILGATPAGRARLDLAHSGTVLLVGFELLEVDGSSVTQTRAHAVRRADPRLNDAPTIYLGPRAGLTAGKAETLSRDHREQKQVMREYARFVPEAADPVEFARRFSLESVARRHGLDESELSGLLRALREFPPSVVLPGPALLRRRSGAAQALGVLALNLWTGGFREMGGLSWGHDPLQEIARQLGLKLRGKHQPGVLADVLRPLLEIKRSPIDVLVCIDANLAHELPGRDQVTRALTHIPFLASFTTHEDETSQLAHLSLPMLLDLESWDLPAPAWGAPEAALQVQRPAVEPVVDGRAVEDVVLALAAAGARGPDFRAPAQNAEGLVRAGVEAIVEERRGTLVEEKHPRRLRAVDRSRALRALLAGEAVWVDERRSAPLARDARIRVATPPTPPADRAPSQLWLVPFDGPAIRGGRLLNRPMMMELSGLWHGVAWETWVELHPRDAQRAGVSPGDRVLVRGPRAEITARAVVTAAVAPGVAAVPVGFGHRALGSVARGHGASPLELPYAELDEETGAPVWGPVPVFVKKAGG
jgi:molybdopterin-containing oxidoreductase family iron-sulfur binding subunit